MVRELAQRDDALLLHRLLLRLVARPDQRVVRLAERVGDRRLVGERRRPLPRLGAAHLALDRAEREDRPGETGGERPCGRGAREEVAERRGDGAQQAGERDRRVVERARRADVRVRGNEVLLGLQDVGPPLEERRGQVRGDRRRGELVDRLAARDRPGIAPEQDRDQVLLRGDLLPDRRDRRERLLVLRPDLRDLGLRHDAGPEAPVEDARGFAEVRRRRLRDLELPVERPHHDVARRDARDDGQHDPALRLLARVHLRLRRLGQPANATEQVELPRRAERGLVEREIRIGGLGDRREAQTARPVARRVGAVADLREQLRARRRQRAGELVDPRCRDAHVAVLPQRRLDQLVQHRIAELLPPFRVRDLGGLRVVDAPRRRRVDRGTRVVRPQRAPGEGDGGQHRERAHLLHACLLAVDATSPAEVRGLASCESADRDHLRIFAVFARAFYTSIIGGSGGRRCRKPRPAGTREGPAAPAAATIRGERRCDTFTSD